MRATLSRRKDKRLSRSTLFPSWPPEPRSAHLLGVGGSGVRALAEFLSDLGWSVTGEDSNPDALNQWPAQAGVKLVCGNDANRIAARRSADVAIRSAAVTDHGFSMDEDASWTYPQVLAEISHATATVAMAGTHGKTTSATLLACALGNAGRLIGGEHRGDNRHGHWCSSSSEPIVIEACEYRGHFLKLTPAAACVLNVEWDHPDHFGNEAETADAFRAFVSQLPSGAPVLIERLANERLPHPGEATVFDVEPCEGFWPRNVRSGDDGLSFELMRGDGSVSRFAMPRLSDMFLGNAVAAAGMAVLLGRDTTAIARDLGTFQGVARRFEVIERGPTIWVDDYAHHPTAIRMALEAIRRRWPRHHVVAVFEPHQAGRLRAFADRFGDALSRADEVVIAPIFAAREASPDESAVPLLRNRLSTDHFVADNLDHVGGWLETRLQNDPQTVVAVFGAGQIGRILDER